MDYDNKSQAGLGALLFIGQECCGGVGGWSLYNDFNPLHFDPRGHRYKNSTEVDITAVNLWLAPTRHAFPVVHPLSALCNICQRKLGMCVCQLRLNELIQN